MTQPPPRTPLAEPARGFDLRWLIQLRWAAIVGELLVITAACVRDSTLPLWTLLALVALGAASNAALMAWIARQRRAAAHSASVLTSVMVLDTALLTALLWFSGGSANPFSALYLVNVALAAALLAPVRAWSIYALSLIAYGGLFIAPGARQAMNHHMHGMVHGAMPTGGNPGLTHFQGMWIAFAITGAAIVYFVLRVHHALRVHEHALQVARERTVHNERLASLATLAAGAAHELSSPLATIAVASGELERSLEAMELVAPLDDARLIREEVQRCRMILNHMARDLSNSAGDAAEAITVGALVDEVTSSLVSAIAVRAILTSAARDARVVVPRRAVAQLLRSLVKNSLDANATTITIQAAADAVFVVLNVIDDGSGMDPDVRQRATEPFFTTKAAGDGMGLGLFLARSVAEQFGGELSIQSASGRGTVVSLRMPREHGTEHIA